MQSLSDTELVCFSLFQYTIQQTALTSALNTKLIQFLFLKHNDNKESDSKV